jgi:hypothetical protein
MAIKNNSSVLLLLFIAIGACFAVDYTEIPATQYSQYPLIPTLRTTGINAILNLAVQGGKIQNTTQFSLSATNHIYLNVSGSYTYYKFNVSLTNTSGDQINAIFEIRYTTTTKNTLITSQSYSIKYAATPVPTPTPTPTPTTPDYQTVPSSEYNSTLIQSLANYTMNYIVTQAVSKGKLPSGDYSLTLIQSLMKQVLSSGVTNYKYEIVFEKTDGTREVEATFVIAYTVSSGSKMITSYAYNVLPYSV